MCLTWLASAAGEQEEGGKVLRPSEMWKSSSHLAEEKRDLKPTRNKVPLSKRHDPAEYIQE